MIYTYLSSFTWPSAIPTAAAGADAFNPKRAASSWSDWSLKCTASECLSMVPVLTMFISSLMTSPSTTIRKHSAGFMLLSKVVQLVTSTVRREYSAGASNR